MRSWTYTYRASDGTRHAGTVLAPDRDAAYAKLRTELGIKPIKVSLAGEDGREGNFGADRDGRRAIASGRMAVVTAVVLIASAIAGGVWWWSAARRGADDGRAAPSPPSSREAQRESAPRAASAQKKLPEGSVAYRKITREVDAACEAYRDASARIDYELLANYALVERVKDMTEFRAIIAQGREILSKAKDAVRRSVEAHYEDIPPSNVDDRSEAQRLYGLVMEELDAADERLESDECALSLLDENRGRWRVVKGAVIWDDPRLERQFRIFGREPSAAASRWERDFGRGRIESAPVALPSAPLAK